MSARIYSRLQALTDAKGVSLREVARDTVGERSFESIRRLAANETSRYSRDLLEKLCDYFDCEISDILVLERNKDA